MFRDELKSIGACSIYLPAFFFIDPLFCRKQLFLHYGWWKIFYYWYIPGKLQLWFEILRFIKLHRSCQISINAPKLGQWKYIGSFTVHGRILLETILKLRLYSLSFTKLVNVHFIYVIIISLRRPTYMSRVVRKMLK